MAKKSAKVSLVAKTLIPNYGTRRLGAGDAFTAPRREAELLVAAGYATRRMTASPVTTPQAVQRTDPLDHDHDGRKGGSVAAVSSEDLTALRKAYAEKLGKRAFPGWGADELQRRMAEAD